MLATLLLQVLVGQLCFLSGLFVLLRAGVGTVSHCLLKDTNDIEVFVVEQDTLLLQVVRNQTLLLTDWLGPPIDFLE